MTPQREQCLLAEIDRLLAENELLRQRVDQILRQLFGAKIEGLDPSQLDLFVTDPDATGAHGRLATGDWRLATGDWRLKQGRS
jgi:hypothetical protein